MTHQKQDLELAANLSRDPQLRKAFKADAALLEAKICRSEALYEGTPKALSRFKDYLRDWTLTWCTLEESARFDEYFLEKYGI